MPLLLIVFAAICYGFLDSFATLSWFNPFVALAVIDGIQGMIIIAWGYRRWPKTGLGLSQVLLLVLLQGSGVLLFLSAIPLAPIGPVVAIYLSAPIIYLLYDIVRGKRSFAASEAALFLLLAAGIALAASVPREGGGSSLLGLAMALVAAFASAGGMALVSRWSKEGDIRWFAGLRSLIFSLCLLPALFVFSPSAQEISWYAAMAFVAAPATVAVWWAVGHMRNTLWSSAALSQSIWAALFAAALHGATLSWKSMVSALLIAGAVFLEQRKGKEEIEGVW